MKKPLIMHRRWPVTAVMCNLSQTTVEIWLYSRIVLTGRQLASWWEGLGFCDLCLVAWSLLCSQVISDAFSLSPASTLHPTQFHTAKYARWNLTIIWPCLVIQDQTYRKCLNLIVLRDLFIISYFSFMHFSYCQQIPQKDQIVFVPEA